MMRAFVGASFAAWSFSAMHFSSTPQSGWMSETASRPDPSGIHSSEPAPPAMSGSLRDFPVATS
jgi:hypothetical protein